LGQQREVIVLDHQHVRMAGKDAAEFKSAFPGEIAASRILRPGCTQHRLGAFTQSGLQGLGAHSVFIHRNRRRSKACAAQRVETTEKAWVFYRHFVAGLS
jgi:hypothetical protein